MPHVRTSEEFLRWQFFDHPAGEARIYVIRDRERIVSMYAAVRQRVLVGDRVRDARMIQDVMTLPDYRGRGCLHLQAQRCWDDMTKSKEVGYTFPNAQSERSFRRTGWHEYGRVPLRTKDLTTQSDGPTPSGYTELKSFDGAVSDIWSRSGMQLGVHRDAAYLNWRYRKPDCEYFSYLANGNRGFLVLKLYSEEDRRVVHICELVTDHRYSRQVENMLQFAEAFARARNADSLTCWLTHGHRYQVFFDAIGLRMVPLDRCVFVKADLESDALVTRGVWHFSQGDSDVY